MCLILPLRFKNCFIMIYLLNQRTKNDAVHTCPNGVGNRPRGAAANVNARWYKNKRKGFIYLTEFKISPLCGPKTIYFIGIGGVSMSGLAEILLEKGFSVAGSDERAGESTERLAKMGVGVNIGHNAANITPDIGLVVYTAAVKADNPEIVAAKKAGLEIIDRAALLDKIIKHYPASIGVSGMHGKTSTTAMLAEILHYKDPTVLIGGYAESIGSNLRVGQSELVIFEACEYFDSFLKFYPTLGLILNIDCDHLDYFKDIDHIRKSFRAYAENAQALLVINADIENLDELTDGLSCRVVTFRGCSRAAKAVSPADFTACNISFGQNGASSFDICDKESKCLARIDSRLTGFHNIENAVAAFAAACSMEPDLKPEKAAAALSGFLPAKRRFQHKGVYKGANITDDYAHHPTEIKMALDGAKNVEHSRIICLFQPHTYTRTELLFDEFAVSFTDADETAFVDIYAAREADPGTVSSKLLAEAVSKTGKSAKYFESMAEAADYYAENLVEGDLLITMGAGDVYLVGEDILRRRNGQ